jgi:hypothetical protein
MSDRAPVTTAADLANMDEAEILEGYLDGLEPDAMAPGHNRSRSYRHGWENGNADRERRARPKSVELARDIIGTREAV